MASAPTVLRYAFALALVSLLLPAPALAYLGPGSGLSAAGAALALLGAIVAALFGFIWYPIKRLIRRAPPAPSGTQWTQEPRKHS